MDLFTWTEQRYAHIRQLRARGDLSAAQFTELTESLCVQDQQGHWWRLEPATGRWYVYKPQSGGWAPERPPGLRLSLSPKRKAVLIVGALGLLSACSGCVMLGVALAMAG